MDPDHRQDDLGALPWVVIKLVGITSLRTRRHHAVHLAVWKAVANVGIKKFFGEDFAKPEMSIDYNSVANLSKQMLSYRTLGSEIGQGEQRLALPWIDPHSESGTNRNC